MSNLEYDNYGFDINKIIAHIDSISDNGEKAEYIKRITGDFDMFIKSGINTANVNEPGNNYSGSSIGNRIQFDSEDFNRLRQILESGINNAKLKEADGSQNIQETNKIIVKSSITDIVRIFEAMKKSGIISKRTEVLKIAKLFFNDPLEAKKFEINYNSRKTDTINTGRNSKSPELSEFIKSLILTSFSKRDSVLEDIVKHIEGIQSGRIY